MKTSRGNNTGMLNIRKGDVVELRIERMAFGGQGVARLDGFVIFVSGAIPGDRALVRVFKKKKDYAEARLTELLEPSPDRVTAPCPYSGSCGGCQWQHVRYETQLEYKKAHILEAMSRIGGFQDVEVHDVIPSEKRYGYRNKMEFSFSDRRWLLPEEMDKEAGESGFALGLHVPGTYHKVLDIEACLLQEDTGNRIIREVKKYVKESDVPVYGLKSHEGFWRFLTLRHAPSCDGWMVNLITKEDRREVMAPLASNLVSRIKNIETVVNNISGRRASIALGEREVVLTGEGYIRDRIGAYSFRISSNSFFQTNSLTAEKLYQTIIDYAELKGSETVLDLYSGTGTIPIFLSGRSKAVFGMEIAESAVLDAEMNCRINGIPNCRFVCGDIRETLSSIRIKPDLLVIDPPRVGMHQEVLAKVRDMAVDRLVYVSCNPATMARDLSQMKQDYQVVEIQPVDMFPQTYHIEAVVKLTRLKRPSVPLL
ncbi:MAG: 23S rRNA (uracil(1939)-C(5))-methyltransferase RlmD [Pseudomonadota bacterium]